MEGVERLRWMGAYLPGLGLLIVGVVLLAISVVDVQMSGEAAFVLAGLGTAFTTVGGVVMGRVSAIAEARRVVAPLAMPAFRRTFTLYQAFGRYRQHIRQGRNDLTSGVTAGGKVNLSAAAGLLDVLDARIEEQLESSNDAAQEWVPIFPEEVALLQQQAREQAEE